MAIDTEDKRRSVFAHYGIKIFPVPDGAITGVDKQHAWGLYRGIAASAVVLVEGPYFVAARDAQVAGVVVSGAHTAGAVTSDSFVPGVATSEAR